MFSVNGWPHQVWFKFQNKLVISIMNQVWLGCVRVSVPNIRGKTKLSLILGVTHFHSQYPGDDVSTELFAETSKDMVFGSIRSSRCHNAHWAKRPKKAFATNLLTLLMSLSPSLCSLSFLTSSPSLSVTPSDPRVLSQPLTLPIYLNKLSLDDSQHAISSNLGV